MNKIVKKSMAGLLAGVMALSSLAVGTTAFAKAPEGATAISVNQAVSFTQAKAEDKVQVYSFKPATTGYYAFTFSSDAVIEKDSKTGKRIDSASLKVSEYDKDDCYDYDYYQSKSQYTALNVEVYDKATDSLIAEKSQTKYGYYDAYVTQKLYSKYTYYFEATLGEYETGKFTKANLVIEPTDYLVDTYTDYNKNEKDETTDIKEDDKTRTYTESKRALRSVRYVGDATDVKIPDDIKGINVEDVDGSENDRLTSLTLGKNVKTVDGFGSQYKLASLTLNDGLEKIYGDAFAYDCALSGQLNIPASVKSIGSYAFYGAGYGSAKINSEKTEIGFRALGFKDVLNDATANPFDTKDAPIDGFFIIAPATSDAVRYAKMNGVTYYDPAKCAAGEHPFALASSTASTYFKAGVNNYVCPACGATKTEAVAKKVPAVTAKSAKKGQLTVKTKALDAKVTGYQIQVSTSKKFKKKATKTITVKTNSKKALNKTIKGLKKGKKYYVRVRVYKGKKKGAYTAAKAVKIKK